MLENITEMNIDEERLNVLTSVSKTNKGIVKHESDHNSIITKFNINWTKKERPCRQEIFNFKDMVGQRKFKEMTSNSTKLSSIFDTQDSIEVQSKKFLKQLSKMLHQCFKKIRVKDTINVEINKLFDKQKCLKMKTDIKSKQLLQNVEDELAEKMADDLYKIVKEEVDIVKSDEGGFNSGHLWRLKNKLRYKTNNPPTAIEDKDGKLVTNSAEIKKVTLEHFKKVLENRPIVSGLEKHQREREALCQERVLIAGQNKTPDWSEDDVKHVIKHLKKKKSRDPHGYSHELIQCGGKDVISAIVKLMNGIKKEQKFPHCLKACNITSLYKNKGSRKDLNMYRGIFRVSTFRNILDRLIFNDEYEALDKNLTDSNVGGRKGRNIRDNIFLLSAITNSIKKGKVEGCDIIVIDVENALMHSGHKNV